MPIAGPPGTVTKPPEPEPEPRGGPPAPSTEPEPSEPEPKYEPRPAPPQPKKKKESEPPGPEKGQGAPYEEPELEKRDAPYAEPEPEPEEKTTAAGAVARGAKKAKPATHPSKVSPMGRRENIPGMKKPETRPRGGPPSPEIEPKTPPVPDWVRESDTISADEWVAFHRGEMSEKEYSDWQQKTRGTPSWERYRKFKKLRKEGLGSFESFDEARELVNMGFLSELGRDQWKAARLAETTDKIESTPGGYVPTYKGKWSPEMEEIFDISREEWETSGALEALKGQEQVRSTVKGGWMPTYEGEWRPELEEAFGLTREQWRGKKALEELDERGTVDVYTEDGERKYRLTRSEETLTKEEARLARVAGFDIPVRKEVEPLWAKAQEFGTETLAPPIAPVLDFLGKEEMAERADETVGIILGGGMRGAERLGRPLAKHVGIPLREKIESIEIKSTGEKFPGPKGTTYESGKLVFGEEPDYRMPRMPADKRYEVNLTSPKGLMRFGAESAALYPVTAAAGVGAGYVTPPITSSLSAAGSAISSKVPFSVSVPSALSTVGGGTATVLSHPVTARAVMHAPRTIQRIRRGGLSEPGEFAGQTLRDVVAGEGFFAGYAVGAAKAPRAGYEEVRGTEQFIFKKPSGSFVPTTGRFQGREMVWGQRTTPTRTALLGKKTSAEPFGLKSGETAGARLYKPTGEKIAVPKSDVLNKPYIYSEEGGQAVRMLTGRGAVDIGYRSYMKPITPKGGRVITGKVMKVWTPEETIYQGGQLQMSPYIEGPVGGGVSQATGGPISSISQLGGTSSLFTKPPIINLSVPTQATVSPLVTAPTAGLEGREELEGELDEGQVEAPVVDYRQVLEPEQRFKNVTGPLIGEGGREGLEERKGGGTISPPIISVDTRTGEEERVGPTTVQGTQVTFDVARSWPGPQQVSEGVQDAPPVRQPPVVPFFGGGGAGAGGGTTPVSTYGIYRERFWPIGGLFSSRELKRLGQREASIFERPGRPSIDIDEDEEEKEKKKGRSFTDVLFRREEKEIGKETKTDEEEETKSEEKDKGSVFDHKSLTEGLL